jgi:hypothetical protein
VLLGMDVEDHVADRINGLRAELRGEIAAASARVAAPPSVVPTFPAREPTVPVRDAAPAREPGRAVAAVRLDPGMSTGGRVAASARPIVPPPPGPGYARQPAGGRAAVAASPGAASVVPAPVPGQRARAAASVPPPIAPVFQPPTPPAARTYGAAPEPEQGGRRRADVTAVDLGYTGRRSRPDDRDGYPPATDGYDGGGYGGGYGDFGDPEPGYPGWAEADERYGEPVADPLNAQYDWRGRERTGGW